MFGFLLTLLIIDGLFLMAVILLQAGKGGGLAAMGGGAGAETLLGGRQAATLLTRATWIAGGIFLFLSLVLAIMSSRQQQPESLLRQQLQQVQPVQPAQPQPVLPGVQPSEGAASGEGAAADTPAGESEPPDER